MPIGRRSLASLLMAALVAAGAMPPGHLHGGEGAHPPVVHAHVGDVPAASTPDAAEAAHAEGDHHDRVVSLDLLQTIGPRGFTGLDLAVMPAGRVMSRPDPVTAGATPDPALATPSPPTARSGPRAPPPVA